MVLGFSVGWLFSSLVVVAWESLVSGEFLVASPLLRGVLPLGWVVLGVLVIIGRGFVVYRVVGLVVNALVCALPVFGVLWVWPFRRMGMARTDLLLLGVGFSVVANLLVVLDDGLSVWVGSWRLPVGVRS